MNFSLDAPPFPQCPNPACTNKNVSALGQQEIKVMPPKSGLSVIGLMCLNCNTIVGILRKK